MTPDQEKFYRGREYNRKKNKQGGTGANQYSEQTRQNGGSASTSEILAEKHGISQRTIEREGA